MTKEDIIKTLKLEPHPLEGGYFRRTYESAHCMNTDVGERRWLTSMYYLLTDDSPIGYLHKNRSDIIHYYHAGAPIRYVIMNPTGEIREAVLGPDLSNGEQLQLVVKGGEWKAAELCSGSYGLLSEAVSPGFDYDDNTLAGVEVIESLGPAERDRVARFLKGLR